MRVALAVFGVALAAGGCATTRTFGPPRETLRVPVEQAVGLTPKALELKLGLDPIGDVPLYHIKLQDGSVEAVFSRKDLLKGRSCAYGESPVLDYARGGQTVRTIDADRVDGGVRQPVGMVFKVRDGVVTAVDPGVRVPQPGDTPDVPGLSDTAGPAELVMSCRNVQTNSEPASLGDAASAVVLTAVLVPMFAVGAPIYGAELSDLNGQLAQLKLGEAPPGGLDAYVAHLPSHVTAKALDDGSTQLSFYINRDAGPGNTPVAIGFVENGVVNRFEGSKCALDGKVFRCHM